MLFRSTLFADSTGPIDINERGGYIQISKSFFQDRIKVTVSGRYDKNQNFKGRFTPRATAVVKVAKNNNIRLSYQTAYRFPSTQQQWINLLVGGSLQLIGGNQEPCTIPVLFFLKSWKDYFCTACPDNFLRSLPSKTCFDFYIMLTVQ